MNRDERTNTSYDELTPENKLLVLAFIEMLRDYQQKQQDESGKD